MNFLQRFPWITFGLLAIAYGMLGIALTGFGMVASWPSLGMINGLVLMMIAFLNFPLKGFRQFCVTQWRKNSGVLMSISLTAILSVIAISLLIYIRVLIYVCIILSATSMARLDLQNRQVSNGVSFALLSAWAIACLNLGWNWSWISERLIALTPGR